MEEKQIIAQLGLLKPTQLKKVKLALDYQLNGAAIAQEEIEQLQPAVGEDDQILFYLQLNKGLADKGIPEVPWGIFIKRRSRYKIYRTKFKTVEAYTNKYFGQLNRRQRQKLYRIYANSLVNWLEQSPFIPLALGAAVSNMDRLPEFMGRDFPGYAECGLLPILLEAKGQ